VALTAAHNELLRPGVGDQLSVVLPHEHIVTPG
jgi:hypothetical protein